MQIETVDAFDYEEKRQLASLTSHPGYVILIRMLESEIEARAWAMREERDEMLLLRRAREWQYLSRLATVLKVYPENAREEIHAAGEYLSSQEYAFGTGVRAEAMRESMRGGVPEDDNM